MLTTKPEQLWFPSRLRILFLLFLSVCVSAEVKDKVSVSMLGMHARARAHVCVCVCVRACVCMCLWVCKRIEFIFKCLAYWQKIWMWYTCPVGSFNFTFSRLLPAQNDWSVTHGIDLKLNTNNTSVCHRALGPTSTKGLCRNVSPIDQSPCVISHLGAFGRQ